MDPSKVEKRKVDGVTSHGPHFPPAKKPRGNDQQHHQYHHHHNNYGRNKRRGNILTSRMNQQAASVDSANPNTLNELKNGLQWLASAHFSSEAAEHARAIQNLIFGAVPASTAPPEAVPSNINQPPPLQLEPAEVKQEPQEGGSEIDYTDVPPPFRADLVLPAPPALPPQIHSLPGLGTAGPFSHGTGASISTRLPDVPNYPNLPPTAPPVSNANSSWPPPIPLISDLAYQSAPFTHPGTIPAYTPQTNTNNYEALEFLGDAYLEVIATRLIHSRLSTHTVGQKCHLRETLVCNDTLASYARIYRFDERLKVGNMEYIPKQWTKVLADVFEAYIAALILSDPATGFQTVETWLAALWAPKIQEWDTKLGQGMAKANENKDAKAELARLIVQGSAGDQRIEYREIRPMEHTKETNMTRFFMGAFYSGCGYKDHLLGRGEGRSKGVAGIEAAKDALQTNQAVLMNIKSQIEEMRRAAKTSGAKSNHGHGANRRNHGGAPRPGPGDNRSSQPQTEHKVPYPVHAPIET